LSLSEVARRTGLNKVTGFRILVNFEARGYVERDEEGRYRLGPALAHLGARATATLDLRQLARPTLEALHSELDETVNLAVRGSKGVVYVDILQPSYGLRLLASVGRVDDYHSTALGKAILGSMSPDTQADLVAKLQLKKKTPNTLGTRRALLKDLRRTAERGFAVDDEENEVGARCVAAPILARDGTVVGAISVSGSTSRLSTTRVAAVGGRVNAAARVISAALGYQVAAPLRPAQQARSSPARTAQPLHGGPRTRH
jgi:IclR family KDG regulon transcriptional repressor